MLGTLQFNLVLIVILDFLHRQESVYTRADIGYALPEQRRYNPKTDRERP